MMVLRAGLAALAVAAGLGFGAARASAASYELCVYGGTDFQNKSFYVVIGSQTFNFSGPTTPQCQTSTATGIVQAGYEYGGPVWCDAPNPEITADRTARLSINVDLYMTGGERPRESIRCRQM